MNIDDDLIVALVYIFNLLPSEESSIINTKYQISISIPISNINIKYLYQYQISIPNINIYTKSQYQYQIPIILSIPNINNQGTKIIKIFGNS